MKARTDKLREMMEQGSVRPVDYYFADLMRRASGSDDEVFLSTCALASHALEAGSICLDMEALAGKPYPAEHPSLPEGKFTAISLPGLEEWKKTILAPAFKPFVGMPDDRSPVVYDASGARIYLRRYYEYERLVADRIKEMTGPGCDTSVDDAQGRMIRNYLSDPVATGGHMQRLAAYTALSRRFTVISGGPGTGKTFTLARVLAIMIEQAGGKPLNISMAAPTGKAAMRMNESIRKAKSEWIELSPEIRKCIPGNASTIHRLLGTISGSPYFRHNRENPLPAQVVIIDEASMIDLAMMAKLMEALAPDCKLILLGDMHQLASVEAGKVYGDICRAADSNVFSRGVLDAFGGLMGSGDLAGLRSTGKSGLHDSIVQLAYSHRFKPESRIGRLSAIINSATNANAGDTEAACNAVLGETEGSNSLAQYELPGCLAGRDVAVDDDFGRKIIDGFGGYMAAKTPDAAFEALKAFRVLCAVRKGPCGVININRLIEKILAACGSRPLKPTGGFYDHRLIMVTENDYSLNLFNGDVGVVFAEADQGSDGEQRFYAYFQELDEKNAIVCRRISVNMLPAHETAFAMTVHKSQGSEFRRVMIILPAQENRVLTKELIYTAITRAQDGVELWCKKPVLLASIREGARLATGLAARLRA